jgi:P27 family predicted phage terminase small subunit
MPKPRIPTAIKKVTGKRGRVPINRDEPIPESITDTPPDWFDDMAIFAWHEMMSACPAGVLSRMDSAIFVLYCTTYSAWREALQKVQEEGTTIISESGNVMQSPWYGQMTKQAEALRKLCSDMGFTPTSRTKVTTFDTTEREEDPAARFFN